MSRGGYFDTNGCYVTPELPEVPARAASTTTDAQLGWNAGANSKTLLPGDVHVIFSFAAPPAGAIIGFKTGRQLPAEPALILHGLYVSSVADNVFVAVFESGRQIGSPVAYTLGNPLEIRRTGKSITYWNNGTLLRTSEAKTAAPVLVNSCLYAAGDTVP
jgi:hypothetical protein